MPVAGNNRWTINAVIKDGKMEWVGRAYMSQIAVQDVDLAIQRLLNGETVPIHQYAPFMDRITKSVSMILGGNNGTE